MSRRRFLAEGIAAGTALGLGVSAADAQSDNPRRIDVHHHLAPPSSRAAALDRRRGDSG